jgi:hypothetical protein
MCNCSFITQKKRCTSDADLAECKVLSLQTQSATSKGPIKKRVTLKFSVFLPPIQMRVIPVLIAKRYQASTGFKLCPASHEMRRIDSRLQICSIDNISGYSLKGDMMLLAEKGNI